MKTNFIYSTNYHDSFDQIIALINARKVDLSCRHLIIVPERYTLLAEKYLYQSSDGSFDVEVLSPSRLFYKMQIETPLLSREGAIMLIRAMLPSIQLKCFHRSASFRGFCEKLYDAINDFAANGIAPNDIPSSSLKLEDLKNVYAEYQKRIEGRFVDSMGKLQLVAKNVATSPYLCNVHVYVVNFDYVDKATQNVLDELCKRALSYTECRVTGEAKIDSNITYFCGEGALAVKEVARYIRRLGASGVPYESMGVILGNCDSARVRRIFGEFDIPCFMSENKRLSDYPLSVFLLKLFECAMRKSRENFIELSKNVYLGVDKKCSDEFENYVNSRLIDYKGFFVEFDEPHLEDVRKKLVSVVKIVEQGSKNISDASGFGKLLGEIFDFVSAQRITERLFDSDAAIERTLALVSLMSQVGVKGSFDFISSVFAEGLRASKMSLLPQNAGVTVGDPAAFRGGKYELLAVLGFDDGFLPQIYDDSSLISDDEKNVFSEMERAEQINFRYEMELALSLASAKRIMATYTSPSGMMSELALKGEQVFSDDYEDILYSAGSRTHATELLISLVGRMESKVDDNQMLANNLFVALDCKDELFSTTRVERIQNAQSLFFGRGVTSVSQLQSYFKCPFRHYAEYGLRLVQREKGEILPPDIGNFMHEIVELALKNGDLSDVDVLVDGVVDNILTHHPKFALESNRAIVEETKKEAKEVLKIYAVQRAKGKFRSLGQEMKFQMPIEGITVGGKIDMADEYDGYVRLIDYKTGKDYELKAGDVYYGKKIQLPLYMAAIAKRGYKKAAILNYPLSYSWLGDQFSHRFSGFVLKDEDVMDAIDSTRSQGESEVFDLKLKRNSHLLTQEEMQSMVDYAVKVSEKAVAEIKDGYVAGKPLYGSCEYCAFACLCGEVEPRKTVKVTKKVFGGESPRPSRRKKND
ncbi:MAG: PD-(D/E)XK nuclease family protein [Clostridia bacterium]|nr:PD-(D/E)XK nuclease family protein [Clostridia bacterium]